MEDHISDFDGITPTTQKCKVCKLNTPDNLMRGEYCVASQNYSIIRSLAQVGQRIFYFAIFFIILSFLPGFNTLKSMNLYVIIVAFAPIFILNAMQIKIHYRGIPKNQRTVHQLRMYNIRGEMKYYDVALEGMRTHKSEIAPQLKLRIAEELVISVLFTHKFNPLNFFEEWSETFDMTVEEFVKYLFDNTEILEALGAIGGAGVLPDVMPYVNDQRIKEKIYDKLAESCEELEMANPNEKLLFQQDVFLVIDDIREDLVKNPKWQPIIDLADTYDAEEPPQPGFMGQIEAFQKQVEEQSKQRMLEMEMQQKKE
ncbi:MAG: hypothetical protein INQ03_11980 [Candidatus Heimdallarchaeota archaeon]|nr:hypothetical protein [Candidatus Heimdallarchaeota archaeon]